MTRSGPAHLPRHHGASTLVVIVPAVSVVATVATAALVVMTVVSQLGATDLLAAAAPLLVVSVARLPVKMIVVSATTTAAIATGPGAQLMVIER